MAGLIIELMDKLDDMADCIDSLTELSLAKKDVIVKNDLDGLKDITFRENAIVGKYQRNEKKIAAIMKDIALVLNENSAKLTLGRLGEIIRQQEDYSRYEKVYERLKQSLFVLKERNEQNNVLIKNALDYIDYTVNVIRSTYNGNDITVDTKN